MIEKIAIQNLFKIVSAFSRGTGKSVQTVSGKYYGNQSFLDDLKSGKVRSITLRKLDLMLQGLSNDWPNGTPWPQTRVLIMNRPSPQKRKKSKKQS